MYTLFTTHQDGTVTGYRVANETGSFYVARAYIKNEHVVKVAVFFDNAHDENGLGSMRLVEVLTK